MLHAYRFDDDRERDRGRPRIRGGCPRRRYYLLSALTYIIDVTVIIK